MRLIKKKCPYCGADLEYHYGEHEAKCNFCKQSLIVEYEKLSFTEVKAMLDYYSNKLDEARRSYDFDDYEFLDGSIDEKEERECDKRINKLCDFCRLCEQMMDEAMEDELERRKGEK